MMITGIFGFLPLVYLLILFLIFHKINYCWRSAILSAVIVWGVTITLSTEILSLFKLVALNWVFMLWLSGDVLMLIIYLKGQKFQPNSSRNERNKFPRFLVGLLAGILLIFVTVGLIAIISPPNNWDSMTYHMSRVVHWMQNRSVEHYPTSIEIFTLPTFLSNLIRNLAMHTGTSISKINYKTKLKYQV